MTRIISVNLDTYMMVFVLSMPCGRATGNLAGDIIGLEAYLFEISEEENILTMDSVERVPDLERLIGIEAAISNRSRGGKARVSEFPEHADERQNTSFLIYLLHIGAWQKMVGHQESNILGVIEVSSCQN